MNNGIAPEEPAGMFAEEATSLELYKPNQLGVPASPGQSYSAMGALATLDTSVVTARAFPRDVGAVLGVIKSLACSNADVAGGMSYVLDRQGKKVIGASIRLAEIVAVCWGNLSVTSDVKPIGPNDEFVIATATVRDLQTNASTTVSVPRSIMTSPKNGAPKRYSTDMIATTSAAAQSIARRNAILSVVPRVFIEQIRQDAAKVARGEAKSLEEQRTKILERMKVVTGIMDEKRILAAIGRTSIVEVTEDDLTAWIAMGQSIKAGEHPVEHYFPLPDPPAGAAAKGIAALRPKAAADAPEAPAE